MADDNTKTTSSLGVVQNDKELESTEKELVKEIKPKLEKFLIQQQVDKAAETARATHVETQELLERMTKEEADKQASKIAMKAFIDLKLWEKNPPPIEYAWLTGKSLQDGHRLTPEEARGELAHDISGFSSYLVREWNNMFEQIKKGEYPNPLKETEESLDFFWRKFVTDMVILQKSEQKYQSLGNKGLLLPDMKN